MIVIAKQPYADSVFCADATAIAMDEPFLLSEAIDRGVLTLRKRSISPSEILAQSDAEEPEYNHVRLRSVGKISVRYKKPTPLRVRIFSSEDEA